MILDFRPVIAAMVRDISSGRRVGEISACFHKHFERGIVTMLQPHSMAADGVDRVCLSGGTFSEPVPAGSNGGRVAASRFWSIPTCQVPAIRRGISLGQAVIANGVGLRGGERTLVVPYPARW